MSSPVPSRPRAQASFDPSMGASAVAHGFVAAGHPDTAAGAAEILRWGGNAVDAAIAGALAAFVAEPMLASAGGGGVMTVALEGGEPVSVDFFSNAPLLTPRGAGGPSQLDFGAVDVDFGEVIQEFHVGRGAAAVPGALAGLAEAHRRFGTLALSELVAPACTLARRGAHVTATTRTTLELLWPVLTQSPDTVALYAPEGRLPSVGSRLSNPDLAETLEAFARVGRTPDRVFEGLLDAFGPAGGGLITAADVDQYRPHVDTPLAVSVGSWTLHPPPLVGGEMVATILQALTAVGRGAVEAEELLRFAEASALGSAARSHLIAPGNTTHVSVVDRNHGVAAVTLSNGEGCGHLIPGTGIQVNNFMGEEDLNPHGFHRHPPGSRMPTMMTPTVGRRGGEPALALGSGGANRIRTAISQVVYRFVSEERTLEEAIEAPRVHAEGDTVWAELPGLTWPDAAEAALQARFRDVHLFERLAFFFGGVHAVSIDGHGRFHGVGDPRRGGVACAPGV